jgi:hypothetical protein
LTENPTKFYLVHEDRPSSGRMALLVPLEDSIFGENVGFVEKEDDLVERLEEVHVIIAVLLKLN